MKQYLITKPADAYYKQQRRGKKTWDHHIVKPDWEHRGIWVETYCSRIQKVFQWMDEDKILDYEDLFCKWCLTQAGIKIFKLTHIHADARKRAENAQGE